MALNGFYDIETVTVSVTPVKSFDCTQITMSVTYAVGMTEMWVPYTLATVEGVPVYSDQVLIDSAELALWGEDDNYIINLVCSKVGVTRV